MDVGVVARCPARDGYIFQSAEHFADDFAVRLLFCSPTYLKSSRCNLFQIIVVARSSDIEFKYCTCLQNLEVCALWEIISLINIE